MKKLLTVVSGLAVSAFVSIGSAQAITIAEANQNGIISEDKIFTNFTCNASGTSAAVADVCNNIDITTLASTPTPFGDNNPGIQFQLNGFATAGTNLDIVLTFDVLATAGLIRDIGLSFAANIQDNTALASIVEQAINGGLIRGDIAVNRNAGDIQDPPYELFDMPLDGLYSFLSIQKDVAVVGGQFGADISIIQQRFFQVEVPEPAVLGLMGLGLLGMGAVARRRKAA